MTLRELIAVAHRGYPKDRDGLSLALHEYLLEGPDGRGDAVARCVVAEITEAYAPHGSDAGKLRGARDAIAAAVQDLQGVLDALSAAERDLYPGG